MMGLEGEVLFFIAAWSMSPSIAVDSTSPRDWRRCSGWQAGEGGGSQGAARRDTPRRPRHRGPRGRVTTRDTCIRTLTGAGLV